MARLFFANIPYDCQETELQSWIESRGFDVDSIRLIRDQVAGVSPSFGYVSMRGVPDLQAAIKTLDGQALKGRKLHVRQDWRDEHYSRRS
jgi:RNA recognition motif-containing protein